MTAASDNKFPKVIITEGTAPSSPSAGDQKVYIDSTTHKLTRKNSSGTVTTIEGISDTGSIATYVDVADQGSDPSSPSAGSHRFYAKAGGLYHKDSSGTVVGAFGAGGGGGITHAYAGYNTIGASTETPTTLRIYMKQIVLANDCMLGGLDLYLDMSADVVAGLPTIALWTDNSGVPLSMIHQSQHGEASDNYYLGSTSSSWPARWIGVGSFGKWLTAGTYWVGWKFTDVGGLRMYYDAGSDRYMTSTAAWLANGDRYSQTDSTRKYSARVSTIR